MRAVTPWKPMHEMEAMQRRMEDMFDRFSGFFGPWERERPVWDAEKWVPAIESHMSNGEIVIKADLPGIDPKEVSISVTGNQLKIEGERKQEEKKEDKDYLYQEVSYGKFSRTMTLPDGVDAEQVKANYKDGVLHITMPAPKQMTSKKVEIEAR